MKTYLLLCFFCLNLFMVKGQNSIIIKQNTPFAHCNGGTINVLFYTNGNVVPNFEVQLIEYINVAGYAGQPNYSYACNRSDFTLKSNSTSGSLINGTYTYALDIPVGLFTKPLETIVCATHPYYGNTYAYKWNEFFIRVISLDGIQSDTYRIKLYNQNCKPILAVRAPDISVPANQPVSVDVSFGPNLTGAKLNANQTIFQLSDKLGSFNNPVVLVQHGGQGLKTSAENTSFLLDLPANVEVGSGYKIKVLSTEPASEETTNSFSITGPLPVTLISFTAKSTSQGNQLKWLTSSEKNFSHFEVQRGGDAQKFESIGKINGSKVENYEFLDKSESLKSAISYYRLKMIDLDGKYQYSKIISVENKPEATINIYPNPIKDVLFLENKTNKSLNLNLLDALGRSHYQMQNNISPKIEMNLNVVKSGIYFLQINDGEQTHYRKIIKE